MNVDIDFLRAMRATEVIAQKDARDLMEAMGREVKVREEFTGRIIKARDAMLPVVTDREAEKALKG